jgi:isopenicillin-N epimerase
MLDEFFLDPSVTHLNHGSFGAVPRKVAEQQRRMRDRYEANPQRFGRVELRELRAQAREVGAKFLGVPADEVALVRNVTESVSTVLSSLAWQGRLRPGDVLLTTEQGYGAVALAVESWCSRTGAVHHVVPLPVDASPEQTVAAFRDALSRLVAGGETVRLVLVDQIASPTGACLPVEQVCPLAHEAGALAFVDGAHVPGQLEVVPPDTGADFWTGTWHKWGFAPRGTSALWVAEEQRPFVTPVTTSWNHGQPFPAPFDMHGTDDYSAWLSLDAAITFWREAGGFTIADRSRRLLEDGAAVVASAIAGTGLPATERGLPADPAPCLRLVALPDGVACTEDAADAVYRSLSERGVETQVVPFAGHGWIRLSAAVYNEPADYERLAAVLPEVLR